MAVAIETKNLRTKFQDGEGETKSLDHFWPGITALERKATSQATDEEISFTSIPIALSTNDLAGGQRYWHVAESLESIDKAGISKLEGVPANLQGFAAHIIRERFPADIEEQIEQAWGD